jgi:hypothetical protein
LVFRSDWIHGFPSPAKPRRPPSRPRDGTWRGCSSPTLRIRWGMVRGTRLFASPRHRQHGSCHASPGGHCQLERHGAGQGSRARRPRPRAGDSAMARIADAADFRPTAQRGARRADWRVPAPAASAGALIRATGTARPPAYPRVSDAREAMPVRSKNSPR